MENRWTGFLNRLKQMKKNQWMIIILSGLLLLVISIPLPEKEVVNMAEKKEVPALESGDHMKELEKKLINTLEQVSGIGKVSVMITEKSSGEKIVEKDRPLTENMTKEKEQQGVDRDIQEKFIQESTVYEEDAGGRRVPYVVEEMAPEIEGVLVVAQGGDHPRIVENITDAVMALFGIEAHKIKVMKMN